MQLVLASASPARLMLLRQAGIEPLIRPTDVDEDALIAAHLAEHGALTPQQYVTLLARAKADAFLSTAEASDFSGARAGRRLVA